MPLLEDLAAALISVFEGCKLTAYKDSGGVWTIGIGHTGPDIIEHVVITLDQAQIYFIADQKELIKIVDLPQYSAICKAALISFGFNCGQSALRKVLTGHDYINNPVHCTDRHGNVLPGLQTRRRLESLLTQL